ncbi:hypothetical protein BCR33DRAFT_712091 [Rhizoclosmatium globosum]|uniref:Uncharacterized protein n=1 Tax=Rhizoclosmatium globosum TaxID=329046 RepID=A0A1Y2CXX2_9FUNG|nr:hypothetical protein BCR33DRAFT_712091 [Rhizoclosmatium globosum]|eukprot:ORY51889.1 hypothetical protein BCR33DRAFT_712091 [Rhizoclosmatium globosum]
MAAPPAPPPPSEPAAVQQATASRNGISIEEITQFLSALASSAAKEGPSSKERSSSLSSSSVESLLGIEKSDENFHKHALIRHLRRLVDSAVGHLLDQQIDRVTSDSHDSAVPLIVDRIMTSAEYVSMLNSVNAQFRRSVAMLTNNANNKEPLLKTPQPPHPARFLNYSLSQNAPENMNNFHMHHHSFSTHSNATNDSSSGSLTSSSFMSPPVEEVKLIISNLQNKTSLETRLGAAQKFNLLSIADLLSSEFWTDTKLGIEFCLADQDTRISGLGLQVCSKAFKSAPPPMTGELFLILVQHLISIFEAGTIIPKLGDHLNPSDTRTDLLLRKIRLLLQFQLELPSCWLRFPDQMFTNCLNAAYRLLRRPNNGAISALHVMAVLDPKCMWFEKWTLSCVGRAQSVASMGKAGVCEGLVVAFLKYLGGLEGGMRVGRKGSGKSTSSGERDEVVVMDVDEAEKGDLLDDGVHDQEGGENRQSSTIIASWDWEYAHFCQVVLVLGKLIRGKAGRSCFPIAISLDNLNRRWKDKELLSLFEQESNDQFLFSVEAFLKSLVLLMCKCPRLGPSKIDFDDSNTVSDEMYKSLHLSTIICQLLQDLTLDEECCRLIYTNKVLKELIGPIISLRQSSPKLDNPNINEQILLNIAQLLSNIASSESGRKLILWGLEPVSATQTSTQKDYKPSFPLQALVQLVVDSLEGRLSPSQTLTLRVLGGFIFVLRQLYRTCEGICLLQQYSLHQALAVNMGDSKWFRAWNSAGAVEISRKEWETMSIDNLLNFAGTPKGVLLLHESGAMERCVAHMFNRYQKKMQVSACEKFGYGVLVSQVSVTAPGMKALCRTGLIGSYIRNLWDWLEFENSCGEPEIEIDDHQSRKIVSSLMKAVSTFSGISSILSLESEKTELDVCTFTYLIRKLVFVDSPVPNDPLITFEESYQIGLRILSLVTSSLDSCILLQTKFHFQESLLKQQEETCFTSDNEEDETDDGFSVDESSMSRCQILVATYLLGGPHERILPEIDFRPYMAGTLELFSQYPCPDCYVGKFNGVPTDNRIEALMTKTVFNQDTTNSSSIRSIQKSILEVNNANSNMIIPFHIVSQLMDYMLKLYSAITPSVASECGWKLIEEGIDDQLDYPKHLDFKIPDWMDLGISMVIRYAKSLLPEIEVSTARRELTILLQRVQVLLKPSLVQKSAKSKSKTSVAHIPFVGFDWFACTVFILKECSSSKSFVFLHQFKSFSASFVLWPARAFYSSPPTAKDQNNITEDIPFSYSSSSFFVELILEAELPHIFSAFTLSGCTPSQISSRWIRECFWNVLDFPEIANYICNTLVFGVDYQVYYCIALFRHLDRAILHSTRIGELIAFLNDASRVGPILQEFRVDAEVLGYMKKLEEKYRILIFSEIK